MDDNAIIKKLDAIKGDATTGQDPLDAIAAELEVALLIERYGNKRKENAIEDMIEFDPHRVAETKAQAIKHKLKAEHTWSGQSKAVTVACNAPAERLNADQFYNELIKAGISKPLLDAAKKAAMKSSAPATSFTATSI